MDLEITRANRMTHPDSHWLELKVPPPLVALLAALGMWGLAALRPGPAAVPAWRIYPALALALVGGAFDLAGLLSFRRARTTVLPWQPEKTQALVQSGVYRLTRNPMYVGLLWELTAWALYLFSPWTLVGPLAFMAYLGRFQIRSEERVLGERFGPEYRAYQARVRRWL